MLDLKISELGGVITIFVTEIIYNSINLLIYKYLYCIDGFLVRTLFAILLVACKHIE